jgi:hypothetical protein
MILDGGLIMGAGGGFNNIENALNIYASDTIEGQTLQAIDYTQGSANVVVKTIDPVFTNNEIAKIAYPDATAQNPVITAQGALSLNDPPNGGLNAGVYINGVQQTLNGSDWSTYPAIQSVAMDTNSIDNAGNITSISTIGGSDMIATNSILVGANSLDVETTLRFTPTNEFFVAKNGDDTTGNGSSLLPYATIGRAIQDADAITPKTGICVINIANGTYTENIIIAGANSGYIQLNGASTSQNNAFGVVIDGNIVVNIDAGPSDLISRQVILSGLQLNGLVSNTSTESHTVIIQNCRFYPNASTLGRSINDSNTATLGNRVLVDNCEYTNDYPSGTPQGPFEFTGKSTLSFTNCDIQSPTISPIITCGGTSFFQRIENCYIESSYNTPTQALVNISSTSTSTHNIALNVFSFTTGTGTTTPAILTSNSGTLFVVSNNFNLVGTNPSTGNCIGYTGTAPTLIYGNNSAVPLYASGVQSGITLLPLVDVGSTPIKATTINATSGVIGSVNMNGNSLSVVGVGQTTTALSVSNGSTLLYGRTTISGSSTGLALNINTGTPSNNVVELNGGTLSTSGASGLKINSTTISSTSNNIAMNGINSITMAGTNPSISAVNSMAITNGNGTTPLTITNSGDNPHIIMSSTGSDIFPVEFTLTNGATVCAIGNQRNNARGFFVYVNGGDAIQISNINRRVTASYSPSSPCFATSGALGTWTPGATGVSFTSTVPYLIGTETITLTQNNFPLPTLTEAFLGLQGNVSYKLNNKHELATTVLVTRTRLGVPSAPVLLYGSAYNIQSTDNGYMTQTLNGISFNEAVPANSLLFAVGDIVTFTVFGTFTGGGSVPNMTVAPLGLSAVISPVFY